MAVIPAHAGILMHHALALRFPINPIAIGLGMTSRLLKTIPQYLLLNLHWH